MIREVYMRDFKLNPYSPDEARVAEWLSDKGVGGGDDPIGFLFTSYEYTIFERNRANDLYEAMRQIMAIEGIEETTP
jgi:hypothetical protein